MARESACAALPLATPQALGFLQLRADPLFHRMTPAQRCDLVSTALADGRQLADEQRGEGVGDPWALAAWLRVPVRESAGSANFGTTVVCAEYRERSRDIVLYGPVLDRIQAVLDAARLDARWRVDVKTAFLAHELYHHLDCLRGGASLSGRHRVCLLRVGRWRWTSGVTSLPEIAAGAFAQSLLDLPFHAKLLELFVVADADPRAAWRYVDALAESSLAFPPITGVPG